MKKHWIFAFISLTAALQTSTAWADLANPDSVLPKRARLAKAAPLPAPAPTAVDESLSEVQIAAALRVYRGDAQCEFSQTVSVRPHPQRAGLFLVSFKNQTYTMAPEPTTTGAVRLEDKRAGMMWLQIPTKSMLMNSSKGQRMVDGCTHGEQRDLLAVNAATPVQIDSGIGIVPVVGSPLVANSGRAPSR